jgi:hypothetical protein
MWQFLWCTNENNGGRIMDTAIIPLDEYTAESDVDELRVPLCGWTDPAAPVDGPVEWHIVRSID